MLTFLSKKVIGVPHDEFVAWILPYFPHQLDNSVPIWPVGWIVKESEAPGNKKAVTVFEISLNKWVFVISINITKTNRPPEGDSWNEPTDSERHEVQLLWIANHYMVQRNPFCSNPTLSVSKNRFLRATWAITTKTPMKKINFSQQNLKIWTSY